MKIAIKGIFVAIFLCASVNAKATGVPVIDVANLANSILQVSAWGEQYGQMVSQIQNQVEQIQKAKEAIENMTGKRLLGMIKDEIRTNDTIPTEVQSALAALEFPSDLTAAIKQITDTALRATERRGTQISGLMREINNTNDPKAIAELQARLGAEQANVQNDTNRILLAQEAAKVKAQEIQELFKTYGSSVYSRDPKSWVQQ